jgi:hypothetical protein
LVYAKTAPAGGFPRGFDITLLDTRRSGLRKEAGARIGIPSAATDGTDLPFAVEK